MKLTSWPQRSSSTSEVNDPSGKKLRTWPKKLTKKKLCWYLKRLSSYKSLKSIFWPRRPSLTLEVKDHFRKSCKLDQRSWQKRNCVIIYNGSWVIRVWNLYFGLGGQRSFQKKVAYLTKEVGKKEIVSISKTVLEL